MIKVKNVKQYETISFAFIPIDKGNDSKILTKNELVTEAKFILVECLMMDSIIGYTRASGYFLINNWVGLPNNCYKPILISETEKIEDGDWVYDWRLKEIYQFKKEMIDFGKYKILVLPEHFSPQQLEMIVKGTLKDEDKVLVECANVKIGSEIIGTTPADEVTRIGVYEYQIKLNPHITMYPVVEKMYTKEEVEKAFKAGKMRYSGCGSTYQSFPTFQDFLDNKEYFWDEGICWTKKNKNGLNKT